MEWHKIWQPYPELCQLQSQLNKGIRACPAFLDQSFPKLSKQGAMKIYVISNLLGWKVWGLNDTLALGEHRTEINPDYFWTANTAILALAANDVSFTVPPSESATVVVWDTAGLCLRPLYSVPPLYSQGGSNLLPRHTSKGKKDNWWDPRSLNLIFFK